MVKFKDAVKYMIFYYLNLQNISALVLKTNLIQNLFNINVN